MSKSLSSCIYLVAVWQMPDKLTPFWGQKRLRKREMRRSRRQQAALGFLTKLVAVGSSEQGSPLCGKPSSDSHQSPCEGLKSQNSCREPGALTSPQACEFRST